MEQNGWTNPMMKQQMKKWMRANKSWWCGKMEKRMRWGEKLVRRGKRWWIKQMRCQGWDDVKWWKNEWGKAPLTESVIIGEMDEAMKMMNEPQTPEPLFYNFFRGPLAKDETQRMLTRHRLWPRHVVGCAVCEVCGLKLWCRREDVRLVYEFTNIYIYIDR